MNGSGIRKLIIDILRGTIDKIDEKELLSPELLSPEEKQLRRDCSVVEFELVTATLGDILVQLKQHEQELKEGTDRLKKALDNLNEVKEVLDAAASLLSVVAKIVTIAAVPAAIPAASLLRARAANRLNESAIMKALKAARSSSITEEFLTELSASPSVTEEFLAEVSATLSESSAEEATVPLPIEEVLYGVELTSEKLIITVATGGCTGEDSFHIDVNKGYTGRPPYLVTVYRIVPDDCKGAFEPMKIAFSREKLGLDGLVEFILRNKIGNTSNHRLNS